MSGEPRFPKITRNRLIGLAVCAVCTATVAIFRPDVIVTIVQTVFGG